jgi:hypothetical protein
MLRGQYADISLPIRLAEMRSGALEEVASRKHERAALLTRDATPRHVLPIRRVKRQFPNIVTARSRTPRRLGRRNAANRAGEVRTMPGFLVERLVQQLEQL